MLRQIWGRGRKEQQRAAPEDPGELTSGVDDIIATFDSSTETGCQEQVPRADSNQRSSGGSKHLPPEHRPPARQGLPPLRAQSLPPLVPGSHLRTASQGAAAHAGPGPGAPHVAPRAQQSCSEQDSLGHRPGGQALPDPWRGDSGQGFPKAWPGPPTEKLLDRLLPGRSWHQEVPGPPHLPQLQTPPAGRWAPPSWSWQLAGTRLGFWGGTGGQPAGRGQGTVGPQSPSFPRPQIRGFQAVGHSAFHPPPPAPRPRASLSKSTCLLCPAALWGSHWGPGLRSGKRLFSTPEDS